MVSVRKLAMAKIYIERSADSVGIGWALILIMSFFGLTKSITTSYHEKYLFAAIMLFSIYRFRAQGKVRSTYDTTA